MQAQTNFVDLTPVVSVPEASPDQRAQIDVNLTGARQVGTVIAGDHAFRVLALDEFGAWETFADDFTGNVDTRPAPVMPRIVNNPSWQRSRLGSIHVTNINVPAT